MPVEPERTRAIGFVQRLDHLGLATTHLPFEVLQVLSNLTLGAPLGGLRQRHAELITTDGGLPGPLRGEQLLMKPSMATGCDRVSQAIYQGLSHLGDHVEDPCR